MLFRATTGSSTLALADRPHTGAEWYWCGPSIHPRPPQSGNAAADNPTPADSASCFQAVALHCARSSRWKRRVPATSAILAKARDALATTTSPHIPRRYRQSEKQHSRKATSLRSPSEQDDLDGLKQDQQIQPHRSVLYVKESYRNFLPRISPGVPYLYPI